MIPLSALSLPLGIYLSVLAFVFGTVFGSFCNAWAWRIVHHEKITKGRSHCPTCGHTLAAKDLVPIFSWLFCKGKCRYCKTPISVRYLITESLLGVYFLSVFLKCGVSLATLRFWGLGSILFVMSLQDLDTMEISDGLQIAAAAFSLLRIGEELLQGGKLLDLLINALLGFAVAVGLFVIVLICEKCMKKELMGGADLKLTAVLGLHFGPLPTIFLLIVADILGLTGAVIMKKGFGKEFPFGPALALAAWITLLAGQPIIDAYLSLL